MPIVDVLKRGYSHWRDSVSALTELFAKYGIEWRELSDSENRVYWKVRNERVQIPLAEGVAYAMPDTTYEEIYYVYLDALRDALRQLETNIKASERC
mgnify:CR=1 FL=1